jgi:hypothetical protein
MHHVLRKLGKHGQDKHTAAANKTNSSVAVVLKPYTARIAFHPFCP